ncbi:phospholipase A-2-activating protein [Nilaparvata lugens]|uniref:phospholipase A-2-activating protein n=1 Tax=Nilaparvata lugens TaxID=108931 RepID=UPI00193E79CC|nr:phospholipase A-2-activating protein [Nilaparvata lugens]
MPFKLSAALYGHSLDVRALAVTSDGRIISASRDKTAKVWKPNLHNAGFCEEQTLKGHSKFVSSVCVLPASEILPGGLILTGSNDNTICAYRNGDTEPAFRLTGHTNAVCCLSASSNPKTPSIVLSSSWDQTAKVWCVGGGGGGEALLNLTGHEAAVWSVIQLSGGHIVTASADKTIRTYTAEGRHQATITGHTDCVRDLAVLQSPTEFLSCANDATIRKWNVLTGECLDIWYGHPHYIYSMSALASGLVVSGGEDRSVFVWNSCGGGSKETITLPAQSVWAVALLPNGDVVTGSSDGVVRVFSCDESRQADAVALAQYEEEIAALTRAASQEVGGVKVSELPGKEALLAAGSSDGQTKLVQESGVAVVYSWSAEKQQWQKVGTAMGSVTDSNSASETGRTTYNGKEYDYVFSVDIEDGKPPLKLPYNDGEDPWHAAQQFIHTNNLNQQFLEQIANFIITNSKKQEPVVLSQAGSGAAYCDPFTGGARYIPEGVSAAPAPQQHLSNGGTSKTDSVPTLFPQTSYLKFDAGNLELIKEKLLEFNKDPSRSVDNESLVSLLRLAESDIEPTNAALDTLQKLLEWPDTFLFPVLDVLRMCLRHAHTNTALCASNSPRCAHIMAILQSQLESSTQAPAANRMLALRCVSNMMTSSSGEAAVSQCKQKLLQVMAHIVGTLTAGDNNKNSHLQVKGRLHYDQLINSCLDAVTLDLLMGLSSKDGDSGQVGKVALCSRQIVEAFAWK